MSGPCSNDVLRTPANKAASGAALRTTSGAASFLSNLTASAIISISASVCASGTITDPAGTSLKI